MNNIKQSMPITEISFAYAHALKQLDSGPVLLTDSSEPAAVLVKAELWDKVADYIDELEATVDFLNAKLQLAHNEIEPDILSDREIIEWIGDNPSE